MSEPLLKLPYINYKGIYKIVEIIPCKVSYQEYNHYHGQGFILTGVDISINDFREYSVDDIIKACFKFALEETGNITTPELLGGLLIKLKGGCGGNIL